jgi:hypothetical protein
VSDYLIRNPLPLKQALAVVFAAGWAAAQGSTLPGGLTFTDMTLSPNIWAHGAVERHFVIENPTPQTHTVTLEIPGQIYSGSAGLNSLSETVVVGPGTRAEVSLIQPPVGMGGSGTVGIRVRGKPRVEQPSRSPSFETYRGSETPSVFVSKGLSAEGLKTRLIECAPAASSSGHSRHSMSVTSVETYIGQCFTRANMDDLKPVRFEGEGAGWPRNWLAFSAFDGCVIAAADYEKMPAEAREALRAYVAAGGRVTFAGLKEIPEGWTETGSRADRPLAGEAYVEAPYGFGIVSVTVHGEFTAFTSNTLVRLCSSWFAARHPMFFRDNAGSLITEIPVTANIHVPVNRFLLILLAFVLIAGPGAVIFTGRANRRIWLLALVPAISILFSAAILVYALVSEGITPALRRQAVTLLDQPRRRAVTLGALAIYAPTSLRDGLHFDRGTEVSPISNVQGGQIESGQDQHFVSGWVTPRLPAFFRLRRSEERVERLLVEEPRDGKTEVVNALGAPILRLRLCDREGRIYETRDLKPGEKRVLVSEGPRTAGAPPAYEGLRSVAASPLPGWGLAERAERAEKQLDGLDEPGPGTYVAVLDGCPFLENPLAGFRAKETARALVAGKY